jgi:hypothetical protein
VPARACRRIEHVDSTVRPMFVSSAPLFASHG